MAMSRSDALLRCVIVAATGLFVAVGAVAMSYHGFDAGWLIGGAVAVLMAALVPWQKVPSITGGDGRGVHAAEQDVVATLVLLLRRPRFLDASMLAWLVENAWHVRVVPDVRQADRAHGATAFVISIDGTKFIVCNRAEPYCGRVETWPQRRDTALARRIAAHRAWISVAALKGAGRGHAGTVWCMVAALAAELADDDTIAFVCPHMRQAAPCHAGTIAALRGSDPLVAFGATPLPAHAAPYPDACEDRGAALARWSEFVTAFENRTDDQCFSVRARFRRRGCVEALWMTVTAMENGVVYGRLASEPRITGGLRTGVPVRVRENEIVDWLFTENGRLRRGSTTGPFGRLAGMEG